LDPVLGPNRVEAEANMRKLAHALGLPVDKISMWIQTDYC
jgi:hypothetical protein